MTKLCIISEKAFASCCLLCVWDSVIISPLSNAPADQENMIIQQRVQDRDQAGDNCQMFRSNQRSSQSLLVQVTSSPRSFATLAGHDKSVHRLLHPPKNVGRNFTGEHVTLWIK
eukprot:TRINITY_DN6258_c0_g1_i1.p1 TRINITY_DN6258_c0_g1~~TRINITY_DN6258_c0_g1_i1.p1  ORF type:complete len:114 (+),score=11.24 TRINITY_DN6258_c0_g1_i1:166-507(+)